MIIATKYDQKCCKCDGQIKTGSLVHWKRGHGIWHLNKEGSYCLEVNHREEEVMNSSNKVVGSSDNDGTINISDLIKALQGMTEKEVPIEAVESPAKEEKQLVKGEKKERVKQQFARYRELTSKQLSFCELMALGSSRADAYTDSYDIGDPVFSKNAARKLLGNEKIRNKIMELRNELIGDAGTEAGAQDFAKTLDPNTVGKGWINTVTEKQEKFCQARASGSTIIDAFNKSGYSTVGWTERRIRKHANRLMKLSKIRNRIADLMSGVPVVVETAKPEILKPLHPFSDQPLITQASYNEHISATNDEFVDNFIELIKAHARLVHHAIVTRGQKEVGIPGADVEGTEAAISRSLETLRDALGDKLSQIA